MEWIPAVPLNLHNVTLLPLRLEDAEPLRQVAELEFFRYYLTVMPASLASEDWQSYIQDTLALPNCVPYAIRVDGELAGMSSFMDIRAAHKGLEIGMTWIARKHQGTHVNATIKLLMLRHAFQQGAIRVQLKMDSRNAHSRRAVEKLGASYEGVLRKHGVQPNGYVRDTVMFSILDTEWREVEKRLLARCEEAL